MKKPVFSLLLSCIIKSYMPVKQRKSQDERDFRRFGNAHNVMLKISYYGVDFLNHKFWGRICAVFFLMLLVVGCGESISQSGNQNVSQHYTNNKQASIDENINTGEAKSLLDYFNKQFPNSQVVDCALMDADNDGFNELLVALNTYSGASKKGEEEARENGFDFLYIGIVFPKGKNPTESVSVLGKTVDKGMRFTGSKLFIVEKKGDLTEQVKVKISNQNGKEDYFTLKMSVREDGTREIQ